MSAQDIETLRDTLDDYHGYVASDPTEPDAQAYAALSRVESRLAHLEEELREANEKLRAIGLAVVDEAMGLADQGGAALSKSHPHISNHVESGSGGAE